MKRCLIPLYGGELRIYTQPDEFDAAYCRLIDKLGLAAEEGCESRTKDGVTTCVGGDSGLIVMAGAFTTRLGAISHEATHCAQGVARAVGMDPLKEEESFAYLQEFFFESIRKAVFA